MPIFVLYTSKSSYIFIFIHPIYKIMSLEAIQTIQNGPFSQYLETSKILGGDIYGHSILVEDTFKSLARFLEAMQKYRRPLIPHEELYFIEPILNNVAAVRNYARQHDKSSDIHHLNYISKCITLFEWIKEQKIKIFIENLDIVLKPYRKRIINQIDDLDDMHEKWLEHWDESFEDLKDLISIYYRNGTEWFGDENVPPSILLGDLASTNIMFEHRALVNEINKGEDILKILKHPEVSNEIPVSIEDKSVVDKDKNKWTLENKTKQSLVITTAEIDDEIFIKNCEDCTIVIENKVHSIKIENCKVITALVRAVSTQLEIIECDNCRVHFFNEIPKIDILKSKNSSVYLSEKSRDAAILTRRCSNTIVNMPFASGLLQSFRIPEEFISIMIPNKGIETSPLQQN